MANWLEKALGKAPQEVAVEPVPYALRCECGEALTGVRQEKARRVICKDCGRAQFVLPINQYPTCSRRFIDVLDEADSEGAVDLDEISVEDEGGDGDLIESAFAKSKSKKSKSSQKRKGKRPSTRDAVNIEMLAAQREKRQKSRRGVAWILAAMCLLTAVMVFWMWRQHQHEQAERRFKESSDGGVNAFAAGDFPRASEELAIAVEAADYLKLEANLAEPVREKFLQAQAIMRVGDVDAFELVAAAEASGGSAEQWESEFKLKYFNQSLIITTPAIVRVSRDEEGKERVELELSAARPLVRLGGLDRIASVLRGPLANVEVMLAGRMQACRRHPENAWLIEFDPTSVCLWQDFGSLQKLGMFSEQDDNARMQFRTIIERQVTVLKGASSVSGNSVAK